jgi:MerR HTH family regulatory protein
MPDVHATCTPTGVGDLARRLGVHTSTVRRWLSGHVLPEPRGPDRPGRWTVDNRPAWCWEHDIAPWLRSGAVAER